MRCSVLILTPWHQCASFSTCATSHALKRIRNGRNGTQRLNGNGTERDGNGAFLRLCSMATVHRQCGGQRGDGKNLVVHSLVVYSCWMYSHKCQRCNGCQLCNIFTHTHHNIICILTLNIFIEEFSVFLVHANRPFFSDFLVQPPPSAKSMKCWKSESRAGRISPTSKKVPPLTAIV